MADVLDILTLDEAKEAINSQSPEHDEQLARQVTAVSRVIDDRCGPVVKREVEAEIHDGGRSIIFLHHWPVASIELVREAQGSVITPLNAVEFGGITDGYSTPSLPSDGSLLFGELRRRYGGYEGAWACGGSVEVTYIAGRYDDTESVDTRFKVAAESILRDLWKREAGSWAQTPALFDEGDTAAGTGFHRIVALVIDEQLRGDKQPRAGIA